MISLLCFIVFCVGSLSLVKEYRQLLEFKRDETTFNEYKNKEREELEEIYKANDFDW